MSLDLAHLRALLTAHANADMAHRSLLARPGIRDTPQSEALIATHDDLFVADSMLRAAEHEAFPELLEIADLLREVLPSVDEGAVGHRASMNDINGFIPPDCDCALCRASALVGEA